MPTHRINLTLLTLFGFLFLIGACGDDVQELTEPEEPELQLAYIGSDACGFCHTETFVEFRKSGHPYKLNGRTCGAGVRHLP